MVRTKRAYEGASPEDGYRVLVDRLWPRGVAREAARLDLWARELAPSPQLRVWFGHDPARFAEFARRYRAELRSAPARRLLAELRRRAAGETVTLVYGARDVEHNGAIVLQALLQGGRRAADGSRRKRARRGTAEAREDGTRTVRVRRLARPGSRP